MYDQVHHPSTNTTYQLMLHAKKSTISQQLPFALVNPVEFDPRKLNLGKYERNVYTIGTKSVEVERSPFVYEDEEQGPCRLYLKAPPQMVYGPGWQHGDTKQDADKEPPKKGEKREPLPESSRTGAQQAYPLTSANTVLSPTEEEAAFIECLKQIGDRTRFLVTRFVKSANCPLRSNIKNGIKAASASVDAALASGDADAIAQAEQEWDETMRSIVWKPKEAVDKNGNPKPSQLYAPLVTYKKGAAMTFGTRYYEAQGGETTGVEIPLRDITFDYGVGSVRGILEPIFAFEAISWGGKKYTFGIKFSLVQALWTQVEAANSTPDFPLFGTTAQPIEAFKPRGKVEFAEEDEEAEAPPRAKAAAKKAPAKAKRAPPEEVEEVEEEDDAPPPRAKAAAKAKRAPPPEEVEEEYEAPPPRAKAVAKAKRAPPPEEVEEEEEYEAPPPRAKASAAKAKRAPPPEEVEEEEYEAPPPRAKAKAKAKRAPPPEEDEVAEDDEY